MEGKSQAPALLLPSPTFPILEHFGAPQASLLLPNMLTTHLVGYLGPGSSLLSECLPPSHPDGWLPSPAGLCSGKPSLNILFKLASHHPHIIFSLQHILPSSFLYVLLLLLIACHTTWNMCSSRTGLLHDVLIAAFSSYIQTRLSSTNKYLLRPTAVLQTLAEQRDIRCTPQSSHSHKDKRYSIGNIVNNVVIAWYGNRWQLRLSW